MYIVNNVQNILFNCSIQQKTIIKNNNGYLTPARITAVCEGRRF